MKRYIVVGGACLVAGFALNMCVQGLRSYEPAPAYALAGEGDSGGARKNLETFGANDAEEMEDAAPMVPAAQAMGIAVGGMRGGGGLGFAMKAEAPGAPPPPPAPAPPAEAPATPGRAWFPETFLFEPLVVTDASGLASVPVKVPDRLTNWRVLALGHSRSGAQAGAVSTFAGTLPTYVDPVLPPFLRAGDTVRLPVQVVNTTGASVTRSLKVEAEGVTVEGG
ncbi:MAG TPA: alpha-2-macroglobulin family protein, partial [Archangium sp.]|nr:alpha-2-macroglobulin family protein [Archangium sp.]